MCYNLNNQKERQWGKKRRKGMKSEILLYSLGRGWLMRLTFQFRAKQFSLNTKGYRPSDWEQTGAET